ncbi:MAG: TonB-dependent receptor [Gemmatimonadota bacterium]|nr:TonB-dependent receptor [Gemmatimonadota bacterium]
MTRTFPFASSLILAISLLTLGFPGFLSAQTAQVTGVVRDANTGEPIPGASVTLVQLDDTTNTRTVSANARGRALFVGVPPDRYRVRVTSIGYGPRVLDEVEVAPDSRHDLGTVGLTVEAFELDALDVTAERSAVTFEADRTAYDITAMPSAQGSAAADLLRNMPELEVDLDGQVSMYGSATEIYIDGRPAPMDGMSLSVFLEQFPAENIERIEVIDSPSARYGAQGSGGIVNIVLREGVELGLTGLAFLNGGTRGELGAGARATLQRGPWTVNSGLNANRSNRESSSFDLRQNLVADPTTFLRQESISERSGRSGNLDLEVRYQPTERARFWVEGRVSGRDDGSEGATTTTHMDENQDPTSEYRRSSSLDAGNVTGRIGTGFTYEWERRRHELEIELDIDADRTREDTREELDMLDPGATGGPLPAELTLEEERQRESEIRLDVDYVRPWSEDGRVEMGYRLETNRDESDRLLELRDTDQAGIPTASNLGFDHAQTFNALYLTLQRQLGPLGVQLGLRGEHSDTRFEVPTGEAFENDYFSLFPSASLSARLDQERQLRLSYSRRIGRPSTSVLNPIDRSTDPLNRRVGNPNVDPEYTHSLSLHAIWSTPFGRLRLSPYYRRTDGGWAEITSVDGDGISTRTWDNVTSEERYGATLTAWLPRGERVSGFVSVGGNRTARDASNLADRYSSSSLRWQTRVSLEAMVTEKLSVESRSSYRPAVDLPQGRSDAQISTDFGLRYRFLDRQASLRMAFEDPLGLRESSREIRDLTHVQIGRSSESSRSIRFSVSYAFGGGGAMRGRGRRR